MFSTTIEHTKKRLRFTMAEKNDTVFYNNRNPRSGRSLKKPLDDQCSCNSIPLSLKKIMYGLNFSIQNLAHRLRR
jgi:hypothetical protein